MPKTLWQLMGIRLQYLKVMAYAEVSKSLNNKCIVV